VLEASMSLVEHLEFRNKVLRLLVQLYQGLPEPDYLSISQCLLHLNDSSSCAKMLLSLIEKDAQHVLIAYQIAFDIEENATQEYLQKVLNQLPESKKEETEMETDDKMSGSDALSKMKTILSGELTIKLYLEFLYRNNHTDLLILKNTKTALDSRNSVFHSAVTFANAFMNAGTTSDEFLRQNLDWLSRASNWTKFSATAALGVIHKVTFISKF
jgi:26S proteasome regulatory subunit N2